MSEDEDERDHVYVHAQCRSDDEVRVFYEVPDGMAAEVRARAVVPQDTFVDCLLHIILEREGALGEVSRLGALAADRAKEIARLKRAMT